MHSENRWGNGRGRRGASWRLAGAVAAASLVALACARHGAGADDDEESPAPARAERGGRVRPGITVLLQDSVRLIAGKRLGLLTNQSGIDEHARSDIDLLAAGTTAVRKVVGGAVLGAVIGNVQPRRTGSGATPATWTLVALFSPEHGIRGTEDHGNIASTRDERTGLPIYSLYNPSTIEPPDSTLRGLDALVIDLQDLGSRTWTYPASMVYAMRAAARNKVPVIVLDRPNPVTGAIVEGPLLDPSQTYAGSYTPARRAQPISMHPMPVRHGLTMGELALYFNDVLALGADLHVVRAAGWRRDMWFDETGLPWVKPSPNMPNLASATLYTGTVPFEGSNLSVGRGTPDAFQRIGAPWLDAKRAVELLNDREMPGVRFVAERFAPKDPSDRKYGGVEVNWIKAEVTDRDRLRAVRVGAAMLWAVIQTNRDSLRLRDATYDERFGAPRLRQAIQAGEDPDSVLDRELASVVEWTQQVRKYRLY